MDPIEHAKQLMNQGRYDEARQILRSQESDPRAYGLLQTLDAIQYGGLQKKKKNDQAEPYYGGYDDYQRASPYGQQPYFGQYAPPVKSYTSIAIGVLILYFVFWVAGLVVNIIMMNEASKFKRDNPYMQVEGAGCLQSLLIVFGALPVIFLCCVFFVVFAGGA